ncbi:MAG: PQ-loop domain-containing transporter [Ilumatobacteraceae bacterium]
MTLESISGLIATACGMAFIWPQVFRLYRRRTVEGLSAATVLIGLINPVLWTVFGYSTGRTLAVFANTNVGLAFILIAIQMVRMRALNPVVAVSLFVSTIVYCLAMNLISPYVVGVTGLLVSTPMFLPQLWKAIRTQRLYGVSVWSNLLFSIQCGFWVAYGIEVEEWLYIYPNAILLPCGVIIAWKVIGSRRLTPAVSEDRRS